MQIHTAIQTAIQKLSQSQSARLDAELLLSQILLKPRPYLYTHADIKLSPKATHHYFKLIDERATGVPVAYLRQCQEFWSLNFKVNEHTLIPRPETEQLITTALARISSQTSNILELGTGCGAVAISLAKECPQVEIIATDISTAALNVATENAQNNQTKNVQFKHCDWLNQPLGMFDMILSNPPYVAAGDPCLQQLRFEPQQALVSAKDGLEALTTITNQARQHLKPKAWLLLEHGQSQAQAVQALLYANYFSDIQTVRDYAKLPRITYGQA